MADADGHEDRLQAARGLASVLKDQRTLDQFERTASLSPLATALLYGSCRYYRPLSAQLSPLLKRPMRKKDQDVWALMIVGAYQLFFLRVPDHAAISATVSAAKRLKKPWASGLVNAVLRNLQRAAGDDRALTDDELLPESLRQALQRAYPDDHQAAALIAALATRAPMALRVNTCRQSGAAYRQRLQSANIAFRQGHAPETLLLETPQPQESLPGFAQGDVAVQDAGAQLAGQVMAQLGGSQALRVLDACAAPGGKLFHFIEQHAASTVNVTALESSPARLQHLQAEAQRLGHADRPGLQLLTGDATERTWWDGELFDLILLDAPCSGSGTLRRHPDIALLTDFADLSPHLALQDRLLENLASLLAPGGHLLYATCSVLPAENDARIAALLRKRAFAHLARAPVALPTGRATAAGWQLLPTDPDTDGFYYAGLKNLN